MTSFFDEHLPTKDDEEKVELCGFICSILKQFDEKLKDIESSIKNIKGNQGQQDINNSTYTEKVIKVKQKVKVKRFFFHCKTEGAKVNISIFTRDGGNQ